MECKPSKIIKLTIFKMDFNHFMYEALNVAKLGFPNVMPNPMVGCVIIKDDEIVSIGYHKKFGEAHAEVNAINNLPITINPKDCTLFVTLEPCCHFGKTPPCADLIINKGFKKVVVCNLDPNPLVAGKGIEKLRDAGVKVITGVLENEGLELNKRFFTFHSKKRPYYFLKWAQTADGFISKWPIPKNRNENLIGDTEQQKKSHQLRATEMAIMVGKNTALWDNPLLTTRLIEGKNPIRILIDKKLEVPTSFNIYNPLSRTIIFNSIKNEENKQLLFIKIDFDKDILVQINKYLFELNIQSVIVEGGAKLLQSFIDNKNYDELLIFTNENLFFETGIKAPIIK